METDVIFAIANLSWYAIVKLIVIIAVSGVAYYFARKYFDEQTLNSIIAKVTALEIQAEQKITGEKKGVERMQLVVAEIDKYLDEKEKAYTRRHCIVRVADSVFKVIKPILPFILMRKK